MSRPYQPRHRGSRGQDLPPPDKLGDGKGGASPYRLGKQFEVSVKGQLQRRGYYVLRAGASKGKIDLLAVARDRPVLFIQCKRLGVIGSAEWNEVFETATAHGGWPIMCSRLSKMATGYFRLDAPREPRKPGRPWTQLDRQTLEPLPDQAVLL